MITKTQKAIIDRLVTKCDRLWRLAVLGRAGGRCELCGALGGSIARGGNIVWVQACHVIGRANWATRWHPRNGVAGCQRCHVDPLIMAWLGETDPKRYEWIIEIRQKTLVSARRDIDLKKVLKILEKEAA